jgi:hypothetical protein
MVGVVRAGHTLRNGRVTAATYARAAHIGISRQTVDQGWVEEALAALGLERNVMTTVSGFATAISVAAAPTSSRPFPRGIRRPCGPACTRSPCRSRCRRSWCRCSGILVCMRILCTLGCATVCEGPRRIQRTGRVNQASRPTWRADLSVRRPRNAA